jgi:diguanylate cyclase (GGDEF)-like protein/putative nucleotidyltransferase with HDIG domain
MFAPPRLPGHELEEFLAVSGTAIAFFVVNTFGVAGVMGLCADESPVDVWKESFLWTAPSYLATACITALAMLLFDSLSALLLFFVPVAYLVYQTYVTYISRAQEKVKHIEEMEVSKAHLADLYLATIKSLALAIDAKDQYTHQHILRVQRYAVAIAKELGLSGSDLEAVNTGALLHDIGKLGVPEYVLMKPGRLTPEEFDKIKKHPEIGEAILDPVEFPWPVLPVVRHHHERYDGKGYPDGLKGEEIPLNARIMAVADVYDALTSSRSYRRAWTHERAVETITKDAGTHFDPDVVAAFLNIIQALVEEMAGEGQGPLAVSEPVEQVPATKSHQVAEDIHRTSTELWALYEVAQSLSSSLGTDDMVEFLCRKLERVFPGSLCVFLLRHGEGKGLRAAAAAGVNCVFFNGASTVNDQSRSAVALERAETFVGEYDGDDLLITSAVGAEWEKLNTSVIVPVTYGSEKLATINCYHADPQAFSNHDVHLLEMIAFRAAQSLLTCLQNEKAKGPTTTDALTGVLNLRSVTETIDALCAAAEPNPFVIMCLDVNDFKPINNRFGYQKGDEVLQELSKILVAEVGPEGEVARYGADEFLILLRNADRESASKVGERAVEAVESFDPNLYHTQVGRLKLGVSLGYASFPEDGADCASLISVADADMYRAKREHSGSGGSVDEERRIA